MGVIIEEYKKGVKTQEVEVIWSDVADHIAKYLAEGNRSSTRVCVYNPATSSFSKILNSYSYEEVCP